MRWLGWSSAFDSWEQAENVGTDSIAEFFLAPASAPKRPREPPGPYCASSPCLFGAQTGEKIAMWLLRASLSLPPLPLPPRISARSVQDLPTGVEGAGLAPDGRALGEVARAPAQGGARRGA